MRWKQYVITVIRREITCVNSCKINNTKNTKIPTPYITTWTWLNLSTSTPNQVFAHLPINWVIGSAQSIEELIYELSKLKMTGLAIMYSPTMKWSGTAHYRRKFVLWASSVVYLGGVRCHLKNIALSIQNIVLKISIPAKYKNG